MSGYVWTAAVATAVVSAAMSVLTILPEVRGEQEGLRPIKGIINGDFEIGETLDDSGWRWWSRDGLGSAEFCTESRKEGGRSVRIEREGKVYSGFQDWTLTNEGRLDVRPGEVWTASVWVKLEEADRVSLDVIELSAEGEPLVNHPPGGGGGTHEAYGNTDGQWQLLQATSRVPPECEQIYVRLKGIGTTKAWFDDVRVRRGEAERTEPPRPKVEAWAYEQERVREELGRGVFAMARENGEVYVRWRLLEEDPADVAFNVYRQADGAEAERLNDEPIRQTTDFVDDTADLGVENRYVVRPASEGAEPRPTNAYTLAADPPVRPYHAIELEDEDTTFQKIGIGDLNGDGRYDFVIKTPNTNIDPWHRPWRPSETTYKLEAYLSDGTFLWRRDLGWNIEAGIWYSPFIVHDFTGDGRAEVAMKTAPVDEDYRETEPSACGRYEAGRVRSGPEYLSVLDGETGEEQARADWPSRDGLGNYNLISRNQMGVAYLDGKTPCIVVARGTYALMKLSAFAYRDGELRELWAWQSPDEPGGFYHGQGAHNLLTMDLDGDGRDEIILGSCVIDDNGDGLWSVGMGHPDNLYVGNLDPTRSGLEIFLGLETDHVRNGICMVDARTGALIWGLNEPTDHIHGSGLVANIDPSHAGMENYAGERHTDDRWLHTARGELLAREHDIPWSTLAPGAAYWDGSPAQRELVVGGRIFRWPDDTIFEGVEGSVAAWVDLWGDWREEIITSVPGEIRIYTTPIGAEDRRVTLMQDHLYRTSVAHMAMGYGDNPPLTSYFIGQESQR